MKTLSSTLVCFVSLSLATIGLAQDKKKPNVARASEHPYADSSKGRENYQLASNPVNSKRLYDFFQRQADFYMANPDKVPAIIPAYPGLDAGEHGHWGKHNQNNHSDTRWNQAEMGEVITQVFRHQKLAVLKGICVRLGAHRELATCFDPQSLSYRAIWNGGFVKFDGFRWGTSRNAQLQGTPWCIISEAKMPEGGVYLGYHRYGKRVVFDYRIKDTTISDEAWANSSAFFRRLDFKGSNAPLSITLPVANGLLSEVISRTKIDSAVIEGNQLKIQGPHPGASLIIRIRKEGSKIHDAEALNHLKAERKLGRRWPEVIKSPGTLGKERKGSAYLVDTLTVPYDNPYKVVMQISGIAFLKNGEALVCTLLGDVWKVSGIDNDLKNITWRRFATGFNQPVGIHIDDDGIFILDRGQIYRLHDQNNDGEVDFYENYANDFGGYDRSHTHTFGLHRTADGAFNFTQRESILRTGYDRKTVLQGSGVRNCMGIGGANDYFWVAPQEGTWTPASAIIEVNRGEFYGLPNKDQRSGTIASPLCFIPRGIENSTGGMVEVTSDKWGPFKGDHIGISYGSGLHYLILRDDEGARPQGAVVPLEGEFISGSMRGAFHPKDGQLYVVGLDGWGDYSIEDGCFHRVRYIDKPVYKPRGFQVHENGIRIDFATKLDPGETTKLANYFAQSWNYEYAKRYGSPEFSAKNPKSLGHDPVKIRSVKLLRSQESIFVEIPSLEPVMQLHIRMHLRGQDGHKFKTDIFASPMYPSPHFKAEGLAPKQEGKPTAISLRIAKPKNSDQKVNFSGEPTEGAIALTVDAIGGLQYKQTELTAKPGQALAITLRNTDVMPHNLVILNPGKIQEVGEASFKMLNDPKAGEKSYVPDLSSVITHIPVIDPGTEYTLHFRAPKQPGDYPYICTYPGHWQAMRGVLKVR